MPADLFREANRLARKLKVSRSELYRRALKKLLEEERDAAITEQLNRVYANEDSSLDPAWRAHVARMLARVEWKE